MDMKCVCNLHHTGRQCISESALLCESALLTFWKKNVKPWVRMEWIIWELICQLEVTAVRPGPV